MQYAINNVTSPCTNWAHQYLMINEDNKVNFELGSLASSSPHKTESKPSLEIILLYFLILFCNSLCQNNASSILASFQCLKQGNQYITPLRKQRITIIILSCPIYFFCHYPSYKISFVRMRKFKLHGHNCFLKKSSVFFLLSMASSHKIWIRLNYVNFP